MDWNPFTCGKKEELLLKNDPVGLESSGSEGLGSKQCRLVRDQLGVVNAERLGTD